jgi:hypothetical protein
MDSFMTKPADNDAPVAMSIDEFRLHLEAEKRRRHVIPTTEFIKPCAYITPEPGDGPDCDQWTLTRRHEGLTRPLPLAGREAMMRTASGTIMLIEQLRAEMPWFQSVINSIERQLELQLMLGRPWLAVRPMLLVGGPGVGKSHFARRLAELAKTGSGVADLAGISDSRLIEGTARGYSTAQPCFPALIISRTGTANPVVILEEIEKAGRSEQSGDPVAALLNLIEPGTARAYHDKALLAVVDISHVNWVATGNSVGNLPLHFLSRVDVFEVAAPTAAMFDDVVATLSNALLCRWRINATATFEIPRAARTTLKRDFARHRSVRRLGQLLEQIAIGCVQMPARH